MSSPRRWTPGSTRPVASLLQALDAHRCQALEIWDGEVGHLDAVDGALPAPQVERPCAVALPDHRADRYVVRRPVGVDHLEVEHVDVGTAHVQPDRLEAALAATDADDVAIHAE